MAQFREETRRVPRPRPPRDEIRPPSSRKPGEEPRIRVNVVRTRRKERREKKKNKQETYRPIRGRAIESNMFRISHLAISRLLLAPRKRNERRRDIRDKVEEREEMGEEGVGRQGHEVPRRHVSAWHSPPNPIPLS